MRGKKKVPRYTPRQYIAMKMRNGYAVTSTDLVTEWRGRWLGVQSGR
jgi:hypothetical protein